VQLFCYLGLCLRGDIGLEKNWREHNCGGGVEGFYNGEAMKRDMDRTVHWGVCDTKNLCGTVFPALRGLELRCRVVGRER